MMQSVPIQFIQESHGFIQFATYYSNSNHAVKSLQCNLHIQSHHNTWLKIIFWKLDLIRSSYQNFCGFSGDQYEHANIGPRN